ncbi:MBL fold metallo-hydrolase [Fluviispira sanaruensis]|uniref:Hydroxyacylglutathione hydrolase n=1 Tax=Fluviispira sanaruensis TaxID=2493639 RepID=A0A4P2VJM3_FLUSA|nr:MBL fold metallo-hydrolase [Fluviispira sanaruensis]BBH53423.1 hydroxyacylglutathione hydrolase [Fluviispira sanaruensis]
MGLIFRQLTDKVSNTYTYIIGDSRSKDIAIVDTVHENTAEYLILIKENNWNLKYLIETHVHADHITAVNQLKNLFANCIVLLSSKSEVQYQHQKVTDGETIFIGNISLQFFDTPGHTPDCISILVENNRLLTGDCMFIGGCGRTDFQSGNNKDMYESLIKIISLPDDVLIYPCHDYKNRFVSTVQEEKITNKQLLHKNLSEFENDLNSWNLPPPKKIKESVPANLLGGLNPVF